MCIRDRNWDVIRAHCRARPRKQGRLQNLAGKLVESSGRADTMAEFLEKAQWKGRPALLLPTDRLGLHCQSAKRQSHRKEAGQVVQKLKWS
eukprot:501713-Pyramimonas_sp.AAC.1